MRCPSHPRPHEIIGFQRSRSSWCRSPSRVHGPRVANPTMSNCCRTLLNHRANLVTFPQLRRLLRRENRVAVSSRSRSCARRCVRLLLDVRRLWVAILEVLHTVDDRAHVIFERVEVLMRERRLRVQQRCSSRQRCRCRRLHNTTPRCWRPRSGPAVPTGAYVPTTAPTASRQRQGTCCPARDRKAIRRPPDLSNIVVLHSRVRSDRRDG